MARKGKGGRFFVPQTASPMVKQLEQLQAQLAKAEEDLGNETVTGTAGGGTVTVVMNGHREILGLKISPEVVDPQDVEMLQDLILAAINDATRQAKELAEAKMGGLTGGLSIPGLM